MGPGREGSLSVGGASPGLEDRPYRSPGASLREGGCAVSKHALKQPHQMRDHPVFEEAQ